MATKILMNVCDGEECRIAVIENSILQEYFVDRPSQLTHVGDVYRAIVTNVESAIQAAFVDLGYRKNAFLHVSDVISAYQKPIKLADLYGRAQVEIIPVEEIDFSKAPDREIELDDEDEEDYGEGRSRGRDDEDGDESEVDPIEAPAIVAKSDFESSRDEFAIQQTVARERVAQGIDVSDFGSAKDAYNQGESGDQDEDEPTHGESGPRDGGDEPTTHRDSQEPKESLTEEEIEERRKAEERRRKGLRRKLKVKDRNGNDEPREHSDSAPKTEAAKSSMRLAPAPTLAPRAPAPSAAPASQVAAPVAPTPVATPARARVVMPPRPEPVGIPVESKAPPRFKLSVPVRQAPTESSEDQPRKAPPPRPTQILPIDAPAVESKAAPRLKLNIARKADPAPATESPAPKLAEDAEVSGRSEEPEVHNDAPVVGFPPVEFIGMDGFGMGALASAERSAIGHQHHRAASLTEGRRFRFMPQPKLQNILHRGQEMLVQVTRAAQGGKGPSVTTYISLPGRYMVLMPNTSKCGVSRKIRDHKTRQDLRKALRRLRIPEGMGIIIRTAAAGRPIEELQRDLNYLLRIWNDILEDVNSGRNSPSCCYRDSDPAVRTVRDYFTKDVNEIIIDDRAVYERVVAFFDALMPDYRDRVKFYDGGVPLFAREGIEPQIEHIFDKKVPLPSGGYLFIEQTEALVAIDVNSGRFTSESSAEETAYKTNLEAVPEIVRQLRLRDLGGIVVGDFIDMMEARHRREVEERIKEELRKGRARVKVATTSPFGLIEMTRQRVRPSIRVYTYSECPTCKGFGHVMSSETQALRLIRAIRLVLASDESEGCVVAAPADVLSYLHSHMRPHLERVEARYGKTIAFEWDPTLSAEELKLWFINRRGDRAVYNLPGELNKFANSRQLAGFDTGGTGRRRRSGARRGGRRDGDAPETGEPIVKTPDDPAAERADVEIVDFDRRGERRNGDRDRSRGPDRGDRGRDRRDDRRGPPTGPRMDAVRHDGGRPDAPRPQVARPADALDQHLDGEDREERNEGRRGRRGRGRGRDRDRDRPRMDGLPQVLPGTAASSSPVNSGSPLPATGGPLQPNLPGFPAEGAQQIGPDGDAGARRRRGRRGGRRHRRPDGTLSGQPNGNGTDSNGPQQYGSIDDVAGQENANEVTITGEDTTDIRRSILAKVEYGEQPEGSDVDTTHRLHVTVQAGASDEVADDRLSEMERHLTVVAAAVPKGLIKSESLVSLKAALAELSELTDASTGEDEAPSAEVVAELRDARERLANAVAQAYQSLPEAVASELFASTNPDHFEQAFSDLMAAMLAPSHEEEAVDTSTSTKKKATRKTAAKKAPATKAAAKKAPAKKAVTKKVAKTAAKKAPAKKSPASKATAKKAPTKKATAKKAGK